MKTLAVVDDHPIYRDGLAVELQNSGIWELVGAFDSVESYLRLVNAADIVLLDYHMPGLHGPAAVAQIIESGSAVLVVSGDVGKDAVLASLSAGRARLHREVCRGVGDP